MRLGILDIAGSIEDTIELARLAEAAGYSRYWIAEHQPQPTPLLIAAIVAGQTERIRVGTAGILFHYYPPLRTAHDFHFLARVYPDRIDAGFCGGTTPQPELASEDQDGREYPALFARYPERVDRLVAHLRNTRAAPSFAPATAWHGVGDDQPAIWSFGGSTRAADQAARLGIGFGYPLMFTHSTDDPVPMRRYLDQFVPHTDLARPAAVIAVCAICAETDAEAAAIAAAPPSANYKALVVGAPATCRAQLAALAARYGVDEIVVADLCGGTEARLRCYQLLAEAM